METRKRVTCLRSWIESGTFDRVEVPGRREAFLVLGEDAPVLESPKKEKFPRMETKETTTLEESPFYHRSTSSARGQAKKLT
jgi:hypothetical protein